MQSIAEGSKALAYAFPSSPTRPPTIVVKFLDPRDNRVALHNFCATYAAKKFIELVLNEHKYKWVSIHEIELQDIPLTIKSEEDLDEIMDHKYSAAEENWEVPQPYWNYAVMLNGGSVNNSTVTRPAEREEPTAKQSKGERPAPKKVKPKVEGETSIAQIAADMGIAPGKARAALRDLKISKPEHGWSWSDPAPIIAQISKHLKR